MKMKLGNRRGLPVIFSKILLSIYDTDISKLEPEVTKLLWKYFTRPIICHVLSISDETVNTKTDDGVVNLI